MEAWRLAVSRVAHRLSALQTRATFPDSDERRRVRDGASDPVHGWLNPADRPKGLSRAQHLLGLLRHL